MWILESNGDFLQGKRMWLKPGKKYLFGRVKKDGVRFAIDHKTVSRKHFIIDVAPVKDEDVGNVHARTKITITDQNSKAGTNIDGELIKDESRELKNSVTSTRPGSCPHELIVSWVPYVLTFSLTRKEIKNGVLKEKQERVKEFDIKAVSDYLTGQTTHLVAQKRNTAKGLQALIEGKFIVTEAYIERLIYASTPTDLQEEENLCPLEIDFDEAWPDPLPHLPPPGKEPSDKPAESYKPDPSRGKIFERYKFVFFDQAQYDTLLPPITTGHGKALLFKVDEDTTTIENGQAYVGNAIGARARAIIVALADSDDSRPWLTKYINDLCLKLGQEPASQSDFLDTILANNAEQLRKPRTLTARTTEQSVHAAEPAAEPRRRSQADTRVGREGSNAGSRGKERNAIVERSPSPASLSRSGSAVPEVRTQKMEREASQQSSVGDDNPRPSKRARLTAPKKLDPFDDEFDPDAIAVYDEPSPPPQTQPRTQRATRAQDRVASSSIKKEVSTPQSSRRESLSQEPIPDSEDEMDELLPAAAVMRKQSQREQAEAKRKGQPLSLAMSQPKPATMSKLKKDVKLMDVRGEVRKQREAEQEALKEEQKAFEDMQAEDHGGSGPANVVRVIEFELPVREKKSTAPNGHRGEDWKPEWDGRKNFKGFRRKGAAEGPRRQKIIIPVVPAKSQTYGLGDQYYEKDDEDRKRAAREKEKKKRASQKASHGQRPASKQSQSSATMREESKSEDEGTIGHGNDHEDIDSATARLQQETGGVLDHPIDVDEPRQTRHGDIQIQTSKVSNATTAMSRAKGAKRPASKTPPTKATTAKKQKTLPIAVMHGSESDQPDDDSDDMKFKFGRGRKARAGK